MSETIISTATGLQVADIKRLSLPAAFKELDAAHYLGMNRTKFRELVLSGLIPFTQHANGKVRIYLRADLDVYLNGLKKTTMTQREIPHGPALKGVGGVC